ncbi:predicted protein [Phaeodactylum tricornutum CCAP 1055/1]|jgi:hypothetical protein|uniref:gamma-glutamylcyclotransferase n=1 Tax=Phaeodactylum tricornutum (strain CCAP 1055/1) TaxID=556484 RepID=B7G643_PHATC|nr:predicted protein [Phaeodactylum tricornutum CCAP 1055/1]EEC45798.1 predicted protein [Phaeodactylum tricornutum CCAP 1055/1]|eukprot:XP_002182511.1 predicted protein [Phaeodactylum tricornutum CCAP 1055/1]
MKLKVLSVNWIFCCCLVAALQKSTDPPTRPQIVQDAFNNNTPLYYFGLGSNMLRSKLENRSSQGKIEILSMEPAVVPSHRLAFNLRGFPPLEPGMGSLEPVNATSRALMAYNKPECHGALVQLVPEMYERVMKSEGVGMNQSGYEEIVVTAVPYDPRKPPVQAIALRAKPHVRLRRDPSPSARYMDILRQGAAELQLKPCYQEFLAQHPVQILPTWLRRLSIYNLIFTFSLSNKLKWRGVSKMQSWLLFRVYVPSNASWICRHGCSVCTAGILLPGAILGSAIKMVVSKWGGDFPPFLKRMMDLLDDPLVAAPKANAETVEPK